MILCETPGIEDYVTGTFIVNVNLPGKFKEDDQALTITER